MFEPDTLLLFLAGALLLNITPGPDMAFTLATSGKGGTRAGVAAALGVGAGSLIWAVLTAAGLAALLAASQHAMMFIRLLGGFYLLYLALETYKRRHETHAAKGADTLSAAFRSGALTNLFNPKVGLFFLAFLPSFTDPLAGPVWLQTLFLGTIFTAGGVAVLIAVAFAAGRARDRIARSPVFRSWINTIAAGVFGALGLRLLLVKS